ncbi:hypothetical protein AB0J89_06470 [Micromonospora chokoriensis]
MNAYSARLLDRVAIVTGASFGIDLAVAQTIVCDAGVSLTGRSG